MVWKGDCTWPWDQPPAWVSAPLTFPSWPLCGLTSSPGGRWSLWCILASVMDIPSSWDHSHPPTPGGVCAATLTLPFYPLFFAENECKPNSDGGGWCIEESKMLSACWGALPCDGDVSPNDCQPTPAAHLPCMICADDLSCSRCHDGRNGRGGISLSASLHHLSFL